MLVTLSLCTVPVLTSVPWFVISMTSRTADRVGNLPYYYSLRVPSLVYGLRTSSTGDFVGPIISLRVRHANSADVCMYSHIYVSIALESGLSAPTEVYWFGNVHMCVFVARAIVDHAAVELAKQIT